MTGSEVVREDRFINMIHAVTFTVNQLTNMNEALEGWPWNRESFFGAATVDGLAQLEERIGQEIIELTLECCSTSMGLLIL